MSALDSTANSEILGEIHYIYPRISTHLKRVISRPIVNDNIVKSAGNNTFNRSDNALRFIVGGYDNQDFWPFQHASPQSLNNLTIQ